MNEKKMYHSLAEAMEALKRGETVYVAVKSFGANPDRLQVTVDIQEKRQPGPEPGPTPKNQGQADQDPK